MLARVSDESREGWLEPRVRLERVISRFTHRAPHGMHVTEHVLCLQFCEGPVMLPRVTVLDGHQLPAPVTTEQQIICRPLHDHSLDSAAVKEVWYAPEHDACILVLKTGTGLASDVPGIAIQPRRQILFVAHNGSIMAMCIAAADAGAGKHQHEQR